MNRCPRFNNCNCPICPLDEKRHLKVKLAGEDSCPYNIEQIREIKKMAKVSDNFKRRPNEQMAKISDLL